MSSFKNDFDKPTEYSLQFLFCGAHSQVLSWLTGTFWLIEEWKKGEQWYMQYEYVYVVFTEFGTELKTHECNAPLAGCTWTNKTISWNLTLCSLFIAWFKCILNVYELRVLKLKSVKKLVGRRKI